ncbi:NrdH-redoxin [Brevibacterium sp. 5221]|uniref:NrdH-redoxin n=1 Tax=Brevibacterium rongguiense TaxID=2695267 RepID=A0A6N9H8R6_9MICO|nr:glutaredoxin family protein [Brevibacterium rongguiense]MYM20480.1 NrdH-redoxin [Brevibacterium rongguiense]
MITVYGKTTCPQCDMTKRVLDREGVSYREVNIEENADALEWIIDDLGFAQAPVVVVGDDTDSDDFDAWSGFRPDRAFAPDRGHGVG